MTLITPLDAKQHPFLTGKPKRLLIGGRWVEAASGKTFETINPSTGEVLAAVAEGDAEDIDRAVSAARAAFTGPWSRFKPFDRPAAEAGESRGAAFRRTRSPRHARHGGANHPHQRQPPARPRDAAVLCRPGDVDPRRDDRELAARRLCQLHPERAGWRGWRHHPVEWAAERDDLENRPGAGHWLHGRAEAGRGSPAHRAAAR